MLKTKMKHSVLLMATRNLKYDLDNFILTLYMNKNGNENSLNAGNYILLFYSKEYIITPKETSLLNYTFLCYISLTDLDAGTACVMLYLAKLHYYC